jgi:hypothetical protein
MIALLCFVMAVLAAALKSKSRARPRSVHKQRPLVLYPAVSMVPVDPAGAHNHPARDPRALAPGRLSLLLALEIAPKGGRPQIDTDLRALIREHREALALRPNLRVLYTTGNAVTDKMKALLIEGTLDYYCRRSILN